MKTFRAALLVSLLTLTSASAAEGPLRILYLGQEEGASSKQCAILMQELGREAIWFDYTADAALATPEWVAKFDAVLLDAPATAFPMLAGVEAKRVLALGTAGEIRDWSQPEALRTMRRRIVEGVDEARRVEWQQFLSHREPEKREANADIANYEKRPEPITLQHPFTVKGSMERTQVPVDMHLELFAAEPDIAKPIAFAWDERGRLWVAETRDYPHGVEPGGEGHDDIKICEDTDGDGRADKFTVFADKLNLPTSLVFANGGIIVSQPPSFLFLKDSNGDDKADVRNVLVAGWGIKDTHAQASNLHWRYDNWIHGCVGYSGFKGTVGGKLAEFTMGTYRFKPDGSAIEFLHQFSNNSWGESQNAAGDDFGGTANGAPIFYGGIPAHLAPAGMRLMSAKRINVEEKAHAITPNYRQVDVFGGYTAAAGSAFIYSKNMPERLQGKAMVCEPTMKIISLMDVQPQGAGYIAKDAFNLVASSDEWMSPVFAEVGPDGAVWFADWQNFIIQHNPTPSIERGGYAAKTGVGGAHENPLRDHARGRIYRVVSNGSKPAVLSLGNAATARLVAALGSDLQERRLTAQRLLVEGGKSDAVPALKQLVTANDGAIGAIHALWVLDGLNALDEATHRAAMLSKDPMLRRNAIRALPSDARGQALLLGSGTLADADPHTRLAALVKLAELPSTEEIKTVTAGLMNLPLGDEWLAEAAKLAARRHNTLIYREGPNLLPNPGFETTGADGLPEGWKRRDYGKREGNQTAEWKVVDGLTHSGKAAVRCITRGEADTSFFAEVEVKPNTQYRLSGWIKTHALKGKASLNDHIGRAETDQVTKESGWLQVETIFNSGNRTRASINLLHVATGDSYFDDVRLSEVLPGIDQQPKLAGDPMRGEQIFFKHPAVSCVLCHMLKGQGSTVGPALDGIATRADAKYIRESLLEPNKVLAKGFEKIGASPMPPLGLILKAQELEDIEAFLQTLR
ncbi:MAG: rane-bound dehydrogenase protein [Chthoniobacteraceae bacterium]|nr:rane-bound dehydrogenase protein [Chthoniobacteraceae bacterium]